MILQRAVRHGASNPCFKPPLVPMRSLTVDRLNPNVKNVEYAVRGELAIKAEKLREQLKEPDNGLPFSKVISSNIGNPQQKGLDQPPITFLRQVAALMEWPELAERAQGVFPEDVVARAKELQQEIGSVGAYSHSMGVPLIRKNVAKFIEARDGHPANPDHIFLTGGASAGVSLHISLLLDGPKTGILIPIPQYPLYTATIAAVGGSALPYHLNEEAEWSTSTPDIDAAAKKAAQDGIEAKALVVINPGNPTGAVLDEETMKKIIKLCEEHSLVLLADEVYQDNLHRRDSRPWTSFKKLVRDMQSPIPLISFHSTSKGVVGECGRRGGYFEVVNVSDEVVAMMYKMVSVGLCPPLSGQIGVDCMVRPPKKGDASYELYHAETSKTHEVLAQRTQLMAKRLDALPGASCVNSPGALYLYPRIDLPPKAIEAAKEAGKAPDALYALQLLDETGICVVPGSGFGQKEGTNHYRLTCLCPGVEEYVGALEKFHMGFMKRYGGL